MTSHDPMYNPRFLDIASLLLCIRYIGHILERYLFAIISSTCYHSSALYTLPSNHSDEELLPTRDDVDRGWITYMTYRNVALRLIGFFPIDTTDLITVV
jgi:hypothetical protein